MFNQPHTEPLDVIKQTNIWHIHTSDMIFFAIKANEFVKSNWSLIKAYQFLIYLFVALDIFKFDFSKLLTEPLPTVIELRLVVCISLQW